MYFLFLCFSLTFIIHMCRCVVASVLGSRSGNVTPGGNISTSRPGSAMSTSTNLSTSGYVARRSVPATRKQRPASIAGTGMSLEGE